MVTRITFDGDTAEDRRLWTTYVHWARERTQTACGRQTGRDPRVIADDPARRIDASTSAALQAIIFASFVLEYRLKRSFLAMKVPWPPKETLGPFLQKFWSRLSTVPKLAGTGHCAPPPRWQKLAPILANLVRLRNDLAHANYEETLRSLSTMAPPSESARHFYNAVVEAIKLINIGTGYEVGPHDEVDRYFEPLKV
jgi:hypothetical protein